MIERLTPIQFDRLASSGRTGPGFITCEDAEGTAVEVVAKLSARCDLGVTSLAIEVLSACLAGDLGLPVPQPYTVSMDPEWLDAVPDMGWAGVARQGSPLAFASKRAPTGFSAWATGTTLLGDMVQTAASVFLFDVISDNPDRRDGNPNCLVRGDDMRIIDHELCFSPVVLLGWRPPWQVGALHLMETPGAHIFRAPLRKQVVDWEPIKAAWKGLSDADLADYAVDSMLGVDLKPFGQLGQGFGIARRAPVFVHVATLPVTSFPRGGNRFHHSGGTRLISPAR